MAWRQGLAPAAASLTEVLSRLVPTNMEGPHNIVMSLKRSLLARASYQRPVNFDTLCRGISMVYVARPRKRDIFSSASDDHEGTEVSMSSVLYCLLL